MHFQTQRRHDGSDSNSFGKREVESEPMVLELTPLEVAGALLKGSSELKFLLERNNVDNDLQAFLYHSGIVTIAVFATIASNAD